MLSIQGRFRSFCISITEYSLYSPGNRLHIYCITHFSLGVEKREKANGLCNPLMILYIWIFSWLLNLFILGYIV